MRHAGCDADGRSRLLGPDGALDTKINRHRTERVWRDTLASALQVQRVPPPRDATADVATGSGTQAGASLPLRLRRARDASGEGMPRPW